jgi:hypothetical protein
MRTWPALLVAPLLALAQQSLMYSLVPPACHRSDVVLLHGISAAAVLACVALALLAWQDRRAVDRSVHREGRQGRRQHMLATIAVMTAAFSALVCAALWAPIWWVSPCAV